MSLAFTIVVSLCLCLCDMLVMSFYNVICDDIKSCAFLLRFILGSRSSIFILLLAAHKFISNTSAVPLSELAREKKI